MMNIVNYLPIYSVKPASLYTGGLTLINNNTNKQKK